MDILVEKIVAIAYVVLGLSMIFQPRCWLNLVDALKDQDSISHFILFFTFLLGLIITFLHPHWTMTPNVIITLLGWVLLIKSMLFFFLPTLLFKLIPRKAILKNLLFGNGILLIGLSILVLYSAYIPHPI